MPNTIPTLSVNQLITYFEEDIEANGIVVASLSVMDPDAGDSYTYELSGPDADYFEIIDNMLMLKEHVSFNFEDMQAAHVTIIARDSQGAASDPLDVTLNIIDSNETPLLGVDVLLNSVAENGAGGDVVAILYPEDVDIGDTVTLSLSGPNASSFEIVGNELRLKAGQSFNYEQIQSLNVSITATDSHGLFDTSSLTLNITDVNDAPVIQMVNQPITSLMENNVDTVIATFQITDPDMIPAFKINGVEFSVADHFDIQDLGNGQFALIALAGLNYEALPANDKTISMSVTVYDVNNPSLSSTHTFTLQILDQQTNVGGIQGLTETFQAANVEETIIGNAGDNDTVSYSAALQALTIDLRAGSAKGTINTSTDDILINIDNVTATSFDDVITGSNGNNTLNGGLGKDTVSYKTAAGAVNVNLVTGQATGDGTDILISIENATGSAFNDTLIGSNDDNLLEGGQGNDTINGGAGIDTASYARATTGVTVNLATGTASGGDGNDTLISIENIIGSDYDDDLTGDAGDNIFYAGEGNNTIRGGGGNDTIDMGVLQQGRTVALGSANQTPGSNIHDLLYGINNANGSRYNDKFISSAADNRLDGREGIDTVSYEKASNAVTIDLSTGQATGDGTDTLINIENATGSNYNDTFISGTGSSVFDGGLGNDKVIYSPLSHGMTIDLSAGTAFDNLGKTDTLISIEHADGTNQSDALVGNAENNILRGLAGNDFLLGGDGDDILEGGTGIDVLNGQTGSDTASYANASAAVTVNLRTGVASGGDGNDTLLNIENINGSNFDDTFVGTSGDNVIDGSNGIDTVSYVNATGSISVNLATSSATGADGNDTLKNIENIDGSNNFDAIYGDSNNNILRGLDGDDFIKGGLGNDTLDGGNGVDTAIFDSAVTVDLFNGTAIGEGSDILISIENVRGSNFNDTFISSSASNRFEGYGGMDTVSYEFAAGGVSVNLRTGLATGDGTDTLTEIENVIGSNFNDTLAGDSGNNTLNGGAGTDTVNYANATAGVTVNLATGVATGDGTDTLISIENAIGSNFNDTLIGNSGNNTLNGGAGIDTVSYANATAGVSVNLSLATAQNTIGAGTDTLIGFENLTGSNFNDTLIGNSGNNTLNGGAGIDTVSYANATAGVTVNLSLATAQNTIGAGTDTLIGFENLTGSSYNDTLTGDANANVLNGGLGNDALNGGAGIDTVSYNNASGAVTVNLLTGTATGADGNDSITNVENIRGSNFNDTLTGNSGTNVLEGGLGNDALNGGAGTDTVSYINAAGAVTVNLLTGTATGADGNDSISNVENIIGSNFNDTLIGLATATTALRGGGGSDVMTGSNKADQFQFAYMTDLSSRATLDVDTITNFSKAQGDKLVFTETGSMTINNIITSVVTSAGNTMVTLATGDQISLTGAVFNNISELTPYVTLFP